MRNHFWSTITDADFDVLAKTIAPLIHLREPITLPLGATRLNLEDVLKTKEMVEFGPQNEAVSISKYKEMVEAKLEELTKRNPILQKLKEGLDITEDEAIILADELHQTDPHITEALLRKVYNHQNAKFIQFIKHILGIEILESFDDQVNKAVQQFITQHSYLSTRQIEFLNLLKNYIIERGSIEKRDLIHAPFTIIHPKGVRGIFSPKEIIDILTLTDKFVA